MSPDAQAQATLAAQPPAETLLQPRPPVVRLTRTARADWQPAEADPPLAAGAVIDGRYRVVTVIGEGGMGRVYETEHLFLRRRLALKLVRRDAGTGEAAARLLQEAVLAGKVPHPTVVPVFDCAALPDGQVYVAMELLRGESLEAALQRPQPAETALRWLVEVARGLAAAHRAGIVHRDVKPANVFLARASDGSVQPRILDFGIAKLLPGLGGEAAAGVQTQAGALLGTPFYMAPERIRGETGDARADLYGLGVMLYEALTGQVPFVGAGFMEIVGRHLREAPLDPRQAAPQRRIPDALAELTLALLHKDPAARPGDGDAVAGALLAAIEREALAGLTLGAEAPVAAEAVTQAIGEASTQQLEEHVVTDMSSKTEVLDGAAAAGVGADGSEDMSSRTGAGRGGSARSCGVGGAEDMSSRTVCGGGWSRERGRGGSAGAEDMPSRTGGGSWREGARASGVEDMSPRTGGGSRRGGGADLHVSSDMSSQPLPSGHGPLPSRTSAAARGLRAAGLMLVCAAAGGGLVWLLLPPAESVIDPPPAAQDVVDAPLADVPGATLGEAAPEAVTSTAPGQVAPEPGPPDPAPTGAAAEPAAPATAGAEPPAGQGGGEAATKKRAKKATRKAGTTEPGPRGSGPKIKTDVYDE